MDDGEIERLLARLLKQDLSEGTEGFRDALLNRCLNELGAEDGADGDEVAILDDDSLEMLAAAGDVAQRPASLPQNGACLGGKRC